jgi:hypothetical protein
LRRSRCGARACRDSAGFEPQAWAASLCSDYSNQAAAQRAADTRDPDGDGIYCESAPLPVHQARQRRATAHKPASQAAQLRAPQAGRQDRFQQDPISHRSPPLPAGSARGVHCGAGAKPAGQPAPDVIIFCKAFRRGQATTATSTARTAPRSVPSCAATATAPGFATSSTSCTGLRLALETGFRRRRRSRWIGPRP